LEPPTAIREDLKANVNWPPSPEGFMVGRLENQNKQENYPSQQQFILAQENYTRRLSRSRRHPGARTDQNSWHETT
jgi:hypothetical protein